MTFLKYPLGLILAVLALHADAQEAAVIPFHPASPTLDGRLREDAWRSALTIDERQFTRWVADEYKTDPNPFTLRLFHDGRALHVSLASYDRFVEAADNPADADGLYALSIVSTNREIRHYRLRWSGPVAEAAGHLTEAANWAARRRGPFDDTTHEGGGYVFELSFPFRDLGCKPGDTLSINVIVQDHDRNPGGRYNDARTEFAKFAWGTLDNEQRDNFRQLRLAPVSPASVSETPAKIPR